MSQIHLPMIDDLHPSPLAKTFILALCCYNSQLAVQFDSVGMICTSM